MISACALQATEAQLNAELSAESALRQRTDENGRRWQERLDRTVQEHVRPHDWRTQLLWQDTQLLG
jgi:fructose-1,6-bisphosphatase/sedoheptulose 1,7-bisphosphatase-like protein